VKERLAKKFPQFDFEAPAHKKEVKLLVAALIAEWELQQQNKTKPTAAAAATAEGGKKRPASAQQQQQQEVEEDDEQERRRRKKEKKEQAAAVSSAASVSSASSASATTAPTGTAATEDPVWKRLLKLAQAMALTPNILKGLKDDPSKRSDELRLRLKAKGAVFNTVPTMEQIKAAAAEQYVLRLFGATTARAGCHLTVPPTHTGNSRRTWRVSTAPPSSWRAAAAGALLLLRLLLPRPRRLRRRRKRKRRRSRPRGSRRARTRWTSDEQGCEPWRREKED